MRNRGLKLHNDYARLLGRSYADMPKAVLAAVAVSYATRCLELTLEPEPVTQAIRDEWAALHENGIVPQRPR